MRISEDIKPSETHDPSFLPKGSSYSIPTHDPDANFVSPTKRTTPRLLRPATDDSTSHRDPIGMLIVDAVSSTGVSVFGANRPTL